MIFSESVTQANDSEQKKETDRETERIPEKIYSDQDVVQAGIDTTVVLEQIFRKQPGPKTLFVF